MIQIKFPDASVRRFESGITVLEVAKNISEGLARNVLSAKFNHQTVEGSTALNWVVSRNTEVLVGEKVVDKNGNDISKWEKMEGVSDLSRNDRQQYIILQLLEEIKNFSSLGELSTFIGTLEDAFVIDENLSLNNAVNILWNFRESNLSDINKLSIPVKSYELNDGRQVLIITENFTDYAELKGLKNS